MRSFAHCVLPLVCCIIITASCYTPRYVYSPAAHNVPLFEKKGDSKLAVDYSTNFSKNNLASEVVVSHSHGIDLQGAYAISKKFALQVNYFWREEKNNGDYNADYLDSSV